MKNSGVEWLGEIPAHWEVKRLKRVTPGLSVGVVVNPSTYIVPEGIPFLYGSDIAEGAVLVEKARRISHESNHALHKSMLRAGDLVTVRVGAPGVTAVIPPELDGCNCASMLIIRRSSQFNSQWLCYTMNSRVVRSQVEAVQYGAAQEQFNVSHAVDFIIPFPPLGEQRAIAELLGNQSQRLSGLIAKVREGIDRLMEFRTALISAAVTGKIDVRRKWHEPRDL